MSDTPQIFVTSHPLTPSRTDLLTVFEPGTHAVKAGYQVAPQLQSLSGDIVLEKDVAVQLRDGVTINVDVFRPAGAEKVAVALAWNPFTKGQDTSMSVMDVFGLVGPDNSIFSGLAKFEAPDPGYWCAQGDRW